MVEIIIIIILFSIGTVYAHSSKLVGKLDINGKFNNDAFSF